MPPTAGEADNMSCRPAAAKGFTFYRAAVAAFVCLFAIGTADVILLHAQSTAPLAQTPKTSPASFEAVSIRPNSNRNPYATGGIGGDLSHTMMRSVTPEYLIMLAYNVKNFQITGEPKWVDTDRYDIDIARDETTVRKLQGMTPGQRVDVNRQMLQSMLSDRFGLEIHRATVAMPVYSLTVVNSGKIPVAEGVCPSTASLPKPGDTPCGGSVGWNGHVRDNHVSISALIYLLSVVTGKTVLDATGLTGKYNIALDWTPDSARLGPSRQDTPFPPPDPNGPSLQEALKEQLGLKLVSTTGPVENIVIDRIERPSPN